MANGGNIRRTIWVNCDGFVEPFRRHLLPPTESASRQHVIKQATSGKLAVNLADTGAVMSSHSSIFSSSILSGTGPNFNTRW